ncbi:MAG: hypothetical protein AAF399_10850 [Bacteroidota bacterium]
MKYFLTSLLLVLSIFITADVSAQQTDDTDKELVLLAGMIQPLLLQGGNFEVDFYTQNMVFNYSHGFSLELESSANTAVGALREQSLAIHLPYSTGFGIGYRLNKYVDVRFEPKLHHFDVYLDGTDRTQVENQIVDYSTVTLGIGAYFRWKPFEKQPNFLKGIFTSTSVRYWQNVYATLNNGEIQYYNRITEQLEVHETSNIGIGNTPWLFNVAVGYAIPLK